MKFLNNYESDFKHLRIIYSTFQKNLNNFSKLRVYLTRNNLMEIIQ
jgi:hypothetical protein